MSLNIKNAGALRLAQAIADATGQTLTDVVTQALYERYARLQKEKSKARVDEILAIAKRVSAYVKEPYCDHAALLHDEEGLPK
jgi:antitoxin VapB